jgi:hypothetical protein
VLTGEREESTLVNVVSSNVSIEPVKVKYGLASLDACAGTASKRDAMAKTRILQKVGFSPSLGFGWFMVG